MIVPKPPVDLEDHCSVVHQNTLYTYSANGFASIPLERNGTWSKLAMGEPVSNAACVTGGIEGDENQQALYVVGGSSTSSSKPGLQRYSFNDKTWKTMQSTGSVTSNFTDHNAVYLKASSSILVYGGGQKGGSSSATWILGTTQPYSVTAGSGAKASPAGPTILLPWNDQEAALIGGETSSNGVHLFDLSTGWRSTKMTFPDQLSDGIECALFRRSDGTKILEAFDMSVSPNKVTSTLLAKSSGSKTQKPNSKKRKRDSAISGYPDYDGYFASESKRQDYSIAQGDGPLVVISSGSGTDSLAIFNQTSNSWVNATQLFYGNKSEQEILATSTSLNPSATPSSSTVTSGSVDEGTSTRTIIGATLGSLLGVAAILILILLFIKLKKDKRKRTQRNQDIDRDRLSFQDQGVEPLTRSAYAMAKTPVPLAASSVDSLAIFSGNLGDEKSPRSAGALPPYIQRPGPTKSSPLTTIVSSGNINTTSEYSRDDKEIEVGEPLVAGRPGDRRTNEGWSKYFQDNSATNLVGTQPHAEPGSRGTLWPVAGSNLPPLNFNFLDEPKPLGRVLSGSPTTEHASTSIGPHIAIPDGQSARISSADSVSLHSEDNDFDRPRAPQAGNWQGQQSWIGRPPSSNYSRSFYNNPNNRDLSSTTAPPRAPDYRKHDSARTNTRGSSILIPDGEPFPRSNLNSDMSWLNLKGER